MQAVQLLVADDGVAQFSLPAAMTIDTVEALATELKQLDLKPLALVLDASHTEIITTPGIQLLLALSKMLESRGIALGVHEPKAMFVQTFEQIGLATQFSQWEASRWLKQS